MKEEERGRGRMREQEKGGEQEVQVIISVSDWDPAGRLQRPLVDGQHKQEKDGWPRRLTAGI